MGVRRKIGICCSLLLFISCQSIPVTTSPVEPLAPLQPIRKKVALPLAKEKAAPIVIKGQIVIPEKTFKTQALMPADIIKQATVSLIDPQSKKVKQTTISDDNGNFEFPVQTQPDGFYFIDIHKRELAIGSPAVFMRTVIQLTNGQLNSLTGNQIKVSPHTTTAVIAALMNKMQDFSSLLEKISVQGDSFLGDITPQVTLTKLNKIQQKVDTMLTNQSDPLKDQLLIVTATDKTGTTRGDTVTIQGLGIDENTVARLEGNLLEVIERKPYEIKVKIPTDANSGDIVLEQSGLEAEPLPIKIATQLQTLSGNFQLSKTGDPLQKEMKLKILDANGDPVSDIPVSFSFTKGSGQLGTAQITTDSNGEASLTGQIDNLGFNDIQASLPGNTLQKTFRHIGLQVAPGDSLHIFPLSESFTGTAREKYTGDPIRFLVINDDGTPRAGASVQVTSYGSSANQGKHFLFKNYNSASDFPFPQQWPAFISDANGLVEITNFYLPYLDTIGKINGKLTGGTEEDVEIPVSLNPPVKTVDRLEIVAGDNQHQEAGRFFAQELKVQAIGDDQQPMINVPVTFSFTAGTGLMEYRNGTNTSTTSATLTTGNTGEVFLKLKAPTTPQVIKIKAETIDSQGIPVEFIETVDPSSTPMLEQISPLNTSQCSTGTPCPNLKVKVLDSNGNPQAGYTVNYEIVAPPDPLTGSTAICTTGTLAAPTAVTGADGIATMGFTAPTNVTTPSCYPSRIKAYAAGVPSEFDIYFPYIYSRPQPANTIEIAAGNNQSVNVGTFAPTQLQIRAFDAYNNPVHGTSGVPIRFEVIEPIPDPDPVNPAALLDQTETSVDKMVSWASGPVIGVSVLPLTSGPITIKATLLGGAGTSVTFTLTGVE